MPTTTCRTAAAGDWTGVPWGLLGAQCAEIVPATYIRWSASAAPGATALPVVARREQRRRAAAPLRCCSSRARPGQACGFTELA
ncbi:hypothetical protein ACFY3G_25795 [Streptomyces phaeochromogenes]|uniref:hypothetical protein n=1 Tax=Streptomyces phaeochromogenes TaxID=1923 RepID=UPI0036A5F318